MPLDKAKGRARQKKYRDNLKNRNPGQYEKAKQSAKVKAAVASQKRAVESIDREFQYNSVLWNTYPKTKKVMFLTVHEYLSKEKKQDQNRWDWAKEAVAKLHKLEIDGIKMVHASNMFNLVKHWNDKDHTLIQASKVLFGLCPQASERTIFFCKMRKEGFGPDFHEGNPKVLEFDLGCEYEHGAVLHCSDEECRRVNVDRRKRFQYCLYCDKVVTIPTFTEAHKHPEQTQRGIVYCKAGDMKKVQAHEYSALKYNGGFDYEHGAYLECTYPPCRKNGIKYRYCKPCHKAVTVTIFSKTHEHKEVQGLLCVEIDTSKQDQCSQVLLKEPSQEPSHASLKGPAMKGPASSIKSSPTPTAIDTSKQDQISQVLLKEPSHALDLKRPASSIKSSPTPAAKRNTPSTELNMLTNWLLDNDNGDLPPLNYLHQNHSVDEDDCKLPAIEKDGLCHKEDDQPLATNGGDCKRSDAMVAYFASL